MSDEKPKGDVAGSADTAASKTVANVEKEVPGLQKDAKLDAKPVEAAKPKSKGYSNPALKAMGIPNLRLPSRNWMIFWCVTSGLIGGVVYDKYQQNKIRKKWMERVSPYGSKPLPPNQLSRKVTVYVAPPPNDFLDESMSTFRKYVKPILNAGGVDYEIKSENRQGVIRSTVAADIRELRRQIKENDEKLVELEESKKWYNKVKRWLSRSKNESNEEEIQQDLLNKKLTDDLNMKNLLGVYYQNIHKDDETTSEDTLVQDPSGNGGIICIGRGAYKEYITGLHEGLLGPLEKPLEHRELEEYQKKKHQEKDQSNLEAPVVESINDIVIVDEPKPVVNDEKINNSDNNELKNNDLDNNNNNTTDDVKVEDDKTNDEKSEEKKDEEPPIPKPFIDSSEYSNATLSPEFKFQGKIPTTNNVSPFFQQPILVIPSFHLNGFLVIPQRIFRFYTRRYLTEEYGRKTVSLVENIRRPFQPQDVNMAKDEEDEWPKKWVQNGLEKKSEWTREFITDDRVLEKLYVYDDSKIE